MLAAEVGYNAIVHGWVEMCAANVQLGLFTAVVFLGSNVAHSSYSVSDYLDISGQAQRTFKQWNIAFLSAATAGFLVRAIEDSSRGTFIVFYFVGLGALYAARAGLARFARRNACEGGTLAARMYIVGFKEDIDAFMRDQRPEQQGFNVVATRILDSRGSTIGRDLEKATAAARELMPDDIFIVVPWQKSQVLDSCVTAFMRVPASLHLYVYPNSALIRFAGSAVGMSGTISSFKLHGFAMSTVGQLVKRASDVALALLALVLLMPLFVVVALAIKLESRGPVFFVQTRSGFNKKPFRIFKFRSMTTTEDGDNVRQATRNDVRITRIGKIMRRYNIDELPQLLNVLRGDMALVGPRPHALVHDQEFETGIALYARRHNVRPGLTGWAQVNGFRGETDTQEKIAQRVACDLYYIDNWSFVLDVWILFLTVFSPKAFRNAN